MIDETLVVQFPSDDFPAPPAFRLAIPREWEAVPMPDAELAVRSREPVAGFHPNVVVRVRRLAASGTPDEDLVRAVQSEHGRPGVEIAADEARTDGTTPVRRMVIRYVAPDATLLESVHLAVYVPATAHVASVVSATGTWAAGSPADVAAAVTATVDSLLVASVVSATGTWAAGSPADVAAAVTATVDSLLVAAPVGAGRPAEG